MRGTRSLLLGLVVVFSLAPAAFGEDPVDFADPNLQAAVEFELGLSNPTPTDMLGLTVLPARERGIVDLAGLEYAVNLAELDLEGNHISDLWALSGLSHLLYLYLNDNQISDLSPLAGLTGLWALALADNQISDISDLAHLTNLWYLDLENNQISLILVLAGLTDLWYVDLESNQISSILALAGLTDLTFLDVRRNPLDADAYVVYIPLIIALNPWIDLYCDPYGASPVYRFWSPGHERHFFTTTESEKDKLLDDYPHIWTYEGVAYEAYAGPFDSNVAPVYRFWSPVLSGHFYTIDEAERDNLLDNYADVWTYEGPAFYAHPEGIQPLGGMPVYRFWSDILSGHFYTISETERDKLINEYSHVWTYERIAWYAYE